MKQLRYVFLCMIVVLMSGISVRANGGVSKQVSIEYLDNGDCIETILEEYPIFGKTSVVRGKKTENYKNSSGTVMWSVTVTGTFSYMSGKSSECTDVSGSSQSYSSSWRVSSADVSKSGNTASASATGTLIVNGVVSGTVNRNVTLSCDNYGNLS